MCSQRQILYQAVIIAMLHHSNDIKKEMILKIRVLITII
jgi:hypothetical protein